MVSAVAKFDLVIGSLARNHLVEDRGIGGKVVGMSELTKVHAAQLFAVVTEHALQGWIAIEYASVEGALQNTDGRGVEDGAIALVLVRFGQTVSGKCGNRTHGSCFTHNSLREPFTGETDGSM